MPPLNNTEKRYEQYGGLKDGRSLSSFFLDRTLAVIGVVYLVLWFIMTTILVMALMSTSIPLIVLLYVSVAIGVSIMGALFAVGVIVIYAR
jgi:hypothetical protein